MYLGGGGGGGYIATTNPVTEQVNGGLNGVTNTLPAFPPNGATKGGPGTLATLPQNSMAIATTDTSICLGDSAIFSGSANLYSSTGSLTWTWSFAGGTPSSSNQQNPTVHYTTAGTYTVKLVVASCNASDSITRTIIIRTTPCDTAHVITPPPNFCLVIQPSEICNVFSPNGDQHNDLFYPVIDNRYSFSEVQTATTTYNFRVFDRWGVKVFESSDYGSAWDGKDKKGTALTAGVYYWMVSIKSVCPGTIVQNFTGFVQLIR